MFLAKTPEPPYYACIFTSQRNVKDAESYNSTAELMDELAAQQDGYLGVEIVRYQNWLEVPGCHKALERKCRSQKSTRKRDERLVLVILNTNLQG